MTDDVRVERAARSWLEAGPNRAPDRPVERALLQIQAVAQDRPWRLTWRRRTGTRDFRLLASAVVVASVLVVGGLLSLRPDLNSSIAGRPSASPPAGPGSTRTFVSVRHGYEISYPSGWAVQPATEPWPLVIPLISLPGPMFDVFTDPADPALLFMVASQPLPAGTTPSAWLTAYEHSAPGSPAACWPAPGNMEHATIDGRPAWVHGGQSLCAFTEALTFAGGRVYGLSAYFFPVGSPPIDRKVFDALLATVRLDPAAADDRPVAPRSP